jgi:uncharacterized protein
MQSTLIYLSDQQSQALDKIQQGINLLFPIEALILYGSVVRGEADNESDIDLLIITTQVLGRTERHAITRLIFTVNLEYDTNFSSMVVDKQSWEKGAISVSPIHREILSEGINV